MRSISVSELLVLGQHGEGGLWIRGAERGGLYRSSEHFVVGSFPPEGRVGKFRANVARGVRVHVRAWVPRLRLVRTFAHLREGVARPGKIHRHPAFALVPCLSEHFHPTRPLCFQNSLNLQSALPAMSDVQKKLQELSEGYQKLQGGTLSLRTLRETLLIHFRAFHRRRRTPEARVAAAREFDCEEGP